MRRSCTPSGSGDVRQPRTGQTMKPKALGGPVFDDSSQSPDRRVRLASWLAGAENPFFAKSLVNRIWYHLLGRGIVEPVDDFRDSNPASNDELLDGLTADFVKNGYHLKSLIRTDPAEPSLSAQRDDELLQCRRRPLLLPCPDQAPARGSLARRHLNPHGTTTRFDGLPTGARATQIPDGKMENPFLKTFGRPARELACECERESESNLSQALQLIGGATVNGKLHDDNGRMAQLAKSSKTPQEITQELYLVALSREPSAERARGRREASQRLEGPPSGHRGPGLGADQLQGIPVPTLTQHRTGECVKSPPKGRRRLQLGAAVLGRPVLGTEFGVLASAGPRIASRFRLRPGLPQNRARPYSRWACLTTQYRARLDRQSQRIMESGTQSLEIAALRH